MNGDFLGKHLNDAGGPWAAFFIGQIASSMTTEQISPAPDWAAVKRAWKAGKLKPKEIAEAFGTTHQKIAAKARAEKWDEEKAKAPPVSTANLMKRLRKLLQRQIGEIETREEETQSAQARERDARTLSSLSRTMEKLIEIEREREAMRRAKAKDGPEDGDALRAELERRLARLEETGAAGTVSEKPEREGTEFPHS